MNAPENKARLQHPGPRHRATVVSLERGQLCVRIDGTEITVTCNVFATWRHGFAEHELPKVGDVVEVLGFNPVESVFRV